VVLRLLLESDPSPVRPVPRVVPLGRYPTTEAADYDYTPEREGVAELVFSVYRDRDGQLLQRVRADLPVLDGAGTGVR
jgi:hypothetical protein